MVDLHFGVLFTGAMLVLIRRLLEQKMVDTPRGFLYALNSEATANMKFTSAKLERLMMVIQNRFQVRREQLGLVPQ